MIYHERKANVLNHDKPLSRQITSWSEDGQVYPSLPHALGGQHTLLKSPFGGGRAGRVKRKNAKKGGDNNEEEEDKLVYKMYLESWLKVSSFFPLVSTCSHGHSYTRCTIPKRTRQWQSIRKILILSAFVWLGASHLATF